MRAAVRCTSSSNFLIILGVNARDTIRRSRACRGSSMLIMEPKYSLNSSGTSGTVKVATFDAEPQQIPALKSNTIQLAIAQSPYQEGQDGVEQAVNALSGKPVTENIGTPLVAIDQKNVNSPSVQKNIYVASC